MQSKRAGKQKKRGEGWEREINGVGTDARTLREGHGDESFSRVMACWVSKDNLRLRRSGLLPLGEAGFKTR